MAASKSLAVRSPTFNEGQTLPMSAVHRSAGGQDISPELSWEAPPPGTKSLAVVCHDPDAPTSVGFTHWILFNLSPELRSLHAGAGAPGKNPPGSVVGHNDYGENSYGGSAPPPGDAPHRYQFTVYALDVPKLEAGPALTYPKFRFLIRGHVLAEGTLTGKFGRPG
jgi:Raf kinase inhibitor-like YbhB/YbcL family protein